MREKAPGYIAEIQGLRTLALLMVATFHIWFDRVSGGVDIFLLVSAFLMTRSLTARSEAGTITRPVTFLLKKFARLMPAAVTVIAITLICVFWFFPMSTWSESVRGAFHAVTYTENLMLQGNAVNYYDNSSSLGNPFQQFWSLAVQGQIFVLFVLVHLASDFCAKLTKISVRTILLVVFTLIAASSFVYSVWLTDTQQVFAYFDTGARIWEFAIGSLLALVSPWVRLPNALRVVFSWTGLIAMFACAFVLPVESSFPGWAALWPITAATLIILSVGPRTKWGADRILTLPLLEKLGGYTYALFLIHWPMLILALFLTKTTQASPLVGLAVLVASLALSFVIVRVVERPLMRWTRTETIARAKWLPNVGWRTPLIILVCLALGAGMFVGGKQIITTKQDEAEQALEYLSPEFTGANALADQARNKNPLPQAISVNEEWVVAGEECLATDPHATRLCYEVPATEQPSERTIFSVGSSHTIQFQATLAEAVKQNPSWSLRSQASPSCYFGTQATAAEGCVDLWQKSGEYIADVQPDLVVLHGTQSTTEAESTQEGLAEWIAQAQLASPETQFVALRDNPRSEESMFECALQNGYQNEKCFWQTTAETPPEYVAELEALGVIWVDLNDFICPDQTCKPAQGGVVTFMDDNHLTGTYMRTLEIPFSKQVSSQISWWPEPAQRDGSFATQR